MKKNSDRKKISKIFRSASVVLLVMILIFFNLVPDLLNLIGLPELEKELRIKNALAAQEIRKPTNYVDTVLTTNPASAYDTTTGGDTTTYASIIYNQTKDPAITYDTWQTTSNTYSALTLYVRRSSSGFTNNSWGIQYSVNGGSNWSDLDALTQARNISAGNVSVSLSPSQNLSQVQVKLILARTKGGDATAEVRIYDIWTDGTYTADTSPPTPNPMTFATAPTNDSTTQISATSTTGSDSTTPVNYLFTLNNSNCGANAGSGGDSSSWQTGVAYSDSGLQPNKCYGYTITARDSVSPTPNTGSTSSISSTYTSANTPGTPTLSGAATSTLNLTNAENSNPATNPTTYFAVQVSTTSPSDAAWLNKWVDASGNASSTAVWLTDAQLDALVLQGLQPATLYGVKVKARNQDGDETPLSAEDQETTLSIGPDATSYTNTETALNFANCATTGCGGRLTQTVTISGINFGASVSNKDTCTAGASNGCVRIGSYTVPAGNISTWNATQIVFTVPAGISVFGGSGTTCGSAGSGVCVTQNANSDDALEFWVFPNITSVSPGGAGEGKEGDSVTITGTRFDSAQGAVVFQNCAGGDVAATVGGWNDTSISVTVPSGINDDDDACDIKVTRAAGTGSKTASSTNFKVLPEVIAVGVCADCTTGGDREYDGGVSTYGIVELTGKHFGAAGTSTILGASATQHTAVEGACNTASYTATAVCFRVPDVSNSLYTGNIILNRTADNKSSSIAFRILPKLVSLSPSSGSVADAVTLTGDHFCQTGTCPGGFTEVDYIKFNSNATSTVFYDWTHTTASGTVPSDAITGNVTIFSDTIYYSNGKNFTVTSLTPYDPTNLKQFKDSGLTQEMAVGNTSSSTPIYLTMTMESEVSGGTLYPQIEYQPIGTPFVCGAGACGSDVEGNASSSPGPVDCSQVGNSCSISISPTDDVYHWQARVRHNKGGSDYYSAWKSYPLPPSDNSEGATDFQIDANGPGITFPGSDTCNDAVTNLAGNSVTISWNLSESGDGQVEYATSSDLSNSNLFPTPPQASAGSHAIDLSNLNSGTTYYFRVKSVDGAENLSQRPSVSPFCSFTTLSVSDPGKTTLFYISGATGAVSSYTESNFLVHIPEAVYDIKSAFVELTGVTAGAGTNNIDVSVNGLATSTYAIAAGESFFRILYPVDGANILLDPTENILGISPSISTNIFSAQIYVTYSFEP